MQVIRSTLVNEPPLNEGDEVVSTENVTVELEGLGEALATDTTFMTPEGNTRIVRVVEILITNEMVTIEAFFDADDGPAVEQTLRSTLESVIIFN